MKISDGRKSPGVFIVHGIHALGTVSSQFRVEIGVDAIVFSGDGAEIAGVGNRMREKEYRKAKREN